MPCLRRRNHSCANACSAIPSAAVWPGQFWRNVVAVSQAGRRGGGREARRLKRGETGPSRAVGPGVAGGHYKPLSDHDVSRIHGTVLDVLESFRWHPEWSLALAR